MTAIERYQYVQNLLSQVAIISPGNRLAWLNDACSGDAKVIEEVLRLLEAEEKAEEKGFLGKPLLPQHIIEENPTTTEGFSPNGNSPSSPDPLNLVGRTFAGSFQIEEFISKGGMGWVYRANQIGLNRAVAVKILDPYLMVSHARSVEHFISEAQIPAHLDHPGIVHIITSDHTSDNHYYIVMEWVNGTTLAAEIRESGAFSFTRAGRILQQVADALAVAHAQGVFHLDIKPSNLMLTRTGGQDKVKVLDFGIAKSSFETNYSQAIGQGTPAYASPEQATNAKVDARADIYSLGVVLYEMLSGELPFKANHPLLLMRQHSEAPRPSLRSIRPDAPTELDKLVRGMMAIDRNKRKPQKMADVPRLFERATAEAHTRQQTKKWGRTDAALLGLVIVLMILYISILNKSSKPIPPPDLKIQPTLTPSAQSNRQVFPSYNFPEPYVPPKFKPLNLPEFKVSERSLVAFPSPTPLSLLPQNAIPSATIRPLNEKKQAP